MIGTDIRFLYDKSHNLEAIVGLSKRGDPLSFIQFDYDQKGITNAHLSGTGILIDPDSSLNDHCIGSYHYVRDGACRLTHLFCDVITVKKIKSIEGSGFYKYFRYDENGRIKTLFHNDIVEREFVYNAHGQLIREIFPDNRLKIIKKGEEAIRNNHLQMEIEYDENGRIVRKFLVDENGTWRLKVLAFYDDFPEDIIIDDSVNRYWFYNGQIIAGLQVNFFEEAAKEWKFKFHDLLADPIQAVENVDYIDVLINNPEQQYRQSLLKTDNKARINQVATFDADGRIIGVKNNTDWEYNPCRTLFFQEADEKSFFLF